MNGSQVEWAQQGDVQQLDVTGPAQGTAQVTLPLPAPQCSVLARALGTTCQDGNALTISNQVEFSWKTPQEVSSNGGAAADSTGLTIDSVVAESPVVAVKPPGSTAPQPIGKDTSLPLACGTLLTVGQSGSAQATFGSQGLCQLTEYEHQLASIVSRDPAGDLLTLQTGRLTCSVNGPVGLPAGAVQCPYGKLIAQRAQFWAICAPDTVFEIAVYLGVVHVIRPDGKTLEVESGAEWAFDFTTGAFSPVPPQFSAQDLRVFRLQAAEMHLG